VSQLQREMRSVSFADVEVKGFKMRGYAAVFDAPWSPALTEKMGYVEKTARGTFRKVLGRSPQVPMRWLDHMQGDVLATTHGKTLRLKEDGKGLDVQALLPQSPIGEHAREMIDRGDVRGMSYGIATLPSDSTIEQRDGVYYRTIKGAQEMLDVTLTFEPAYDSTSVELRTVGFAAVPLQALIVGEGAQLDPARQASPDPADAWWGDDPEQDSDDPAAGEARATRRAWEVVIDELEREGNF
jgi:HK97 family phage prohead protease